MESSFDSLLRPISCLYGDLAHITSFKKIVEGREDWKLVCDERTNVKVLAMCLVGVKPDQASCVKTFAEALGLVHLDQSTNTRRGETESICIAWSDELQCVSSASANIQLCSHVELRNYKLILRDRNGLHCVVGGARLEIVDTEALLQLAPNSAFKYPAESLKESLTEATKLSCIALKELNPRDSVKFNKLRQNSSTQSSSTLSSLENFQTWFNKQVQQQTPPPQPAPTKVKHKFKPWKNTTKPAAPYVPTPVECWKKECLKTSSFFECALLSTCGIQHNTSDFQMCIYTIEPPKVVFSEDGSLISTSTPFPMERDSRPFK